MMRVALVMVWLGGCSAASVPSVPPQQNPSHPPAAPTPTQEVKRAPAPSSASAAAPIASPEPAGKPCGALDCLAFATPEAAFERVLESQPKILAIGETHAQADASGVATSTHRFAERLLPHLQGKAHHLVIELLLGNRQCKPGVEKEVVKRQAPVTEHQAKTNQNDIVTLGKYAQRYGIEPEGLTPRCEDYEAVAAAGENDISRLLQLIAEQTTRQVEAILAKNESGIVLTYGGALHNDRQPRPGQEAWVFGPKLAADSAGQYVELDLIVPEFVQDTAAWRALPWFSAFDREHLSSETLLFQPAPQSFVLIFPKTEKAPPKPL